MLGIIAMASVPLTSIFVIVCFILKSILTFFATSKLRRKENWHIFVHRRKKEICMLNCLFVGIGGFIGSICRYLVGLIPLKENSSFPFKTLCINIVGAFVLGLLSAYAAKNPNVNPRVMPTLPPDTKIVSNRIIVSSKMVVNGFFMLLGRLST